MRVLFTSVLLCLCLNLWAQDMSYLPAGLHKLSKQELKEIPLTLKGIPFYLQGKQVSRKELGDLVSNEAYALDYYGDQKGKIKAVVIRDANPGEEKAKKELIAAPRNPIDWRGRAAPVFERIDLNGREVSLTELKGKIVVLAFWYTDCKSCIREMPTLNKMANSYKNEEVVFLAPTKNIALDVKDFLKNQKFDFKILPNTSSLGRRYGVMTYPMYFIIDQQGTVQFCQYNASKETLKTLSTQINLLLK